MWLLAGLGAGSACIRAGRRLDRGDRRSGGHRNLGCSDDVAHATQGAVRSGSVLHRRSGHGHDGVHGPQVPQSGLPSRGARSAFTPGRSHGGRGGDCVRSRILPGMSWLAQWTRAHSVPVSRVLVAVAALAMIVMLARPIFYHAFRNYVRGFHHLGRRQTEGGIAHLRSYAELRRAVVDLDSLVSPTAGLLSSWLASPGSMPFASASGGGLPQLSWSPP